MTAGKQRFLLLLLSTATTGGCSSSAGPMDGAGDGGDELLCDPGPRQAVWLTEGETAEIRVGCNAPHAGEVSGDRFALDGLPAGAVYDPATATISWLTELDDAGVYDVAVSVPDLDESGVLRIGVADRWDHPDNFAIVDPLAYPLEFGVPVFHLSPAPEDSENYAPTSIVYGGRDHRAEAKKRGRTSLDYPANSYTLKFPSSYRFTDPDRAGGFVNKRKVVLTQQFDDNSYIRTRLAFDLWNRLEPSVSVQSYTAVLYIEGEFQGIYTVSDHIDDDLMVEHGLPKAGNLYKAINHDANFRLVGKDGQPKDTLYDGYEKKSGLPEEGQPGAFADLEELVQFVATASDGEFAAHIGARIDVDDYMSWLLLTTFLGADDNGGKNTYHYHDGETRWKIIPWDFNASSGQMYTTERRAVDSVDYFEWANELFVRMLDEPALARAIAQRYREHLAGAFSDAALQAHIDGYSVEIPGPVIARDEARWNAARRSYGDWSHRTDFTTSAEELAYVRAWLSERVAFFEALY